MKYCILSRDFEESNKIKEYIKLNLKHEYNNNNPDIVIAIGGDGTIIKAAHEYPKAILFGIHTGHLGFYANYLVNDVDLLINDINTNNYNIEEYSLLQAEFVSKNGTVTNDFALNEVTISSPLRTLTLDVYIDDHFLEKYRGTGLCISTPSGSTAYNKSLHGAVVDNLVNVIQLTEIAGINSNAYRTISSPMVLSDKRRIKLEVEAKTYQETSDLFITADHVSYPVKELKTLYIFLSGKKLKMASHDKKNFMDRITRTFLVSKE